MASIRTFFAIEVPDVIRKEMAALAVELKKSSADVKWETQDKFHATIKFLGNIEESFLPALFAKGESVLHKLQPFEIIFQTLGAFPDKKHPHVIWIGCENPAGTLSQMKELLDDALVPLGFEKETRLFHPHITLGRVKSDRALKNLTPMLEKLTFEPRRTTVEGIVVMKSTLKPEGSEYSILKEIHFQK